ncbi:hypothetical protein ANRL2_02317 [Anaerolineae bacterium]|nr:hypothetical protein ANRL2_02317 [Anaerolineae bacterium]
MRGSDINSPLQFSGKGTWSSQPVRLAQGSYRLEYRFPAAVLARLGLVSAIDGADDTLFIKSGSGVVGFDAAAQGRYIVQVQPADESAEWQLEIRRVERFRADDAEKGD